jgi:hypothetical protein
MNFNPDEASEDELRKFFRVEKDKNALADMSEKMFEHLRERLKFR